MGGVVGKKTMKKALKSKYNEENSLIVIAGYPKKGERYSRNVCAVSSFTKNSLLALQKENPNRKIVVLTMALGGKEIYEENGMLVVRCFERNNPLSYLSLINYVRTFNKVKQILVEFEFSTFGDTLSTLMFAPVIIAIKSLGRDITLVMHQVLLNLKKLSGHVGIASKNPKLNFMNVGLSIFYRFLTFPAKNIVVLEEEFKKRLSKFANPQKISVIPHGVDKQLNSSSTSLRAKYGFKKDDFVILYFGYLTWYKGVDFLIDSFKNVRKLNNRNIKILIAGGPSFTQREKPHYKRFVSQVLELTKNQKHIKITGFVKEKEFAKIFETADLAVLPYRTFMSSSGPLSLALTFKKPFILSENLKNLTESEDFSKALELSGLKENQIFFKLSKSSLVSAIENAMDKTRTKKLEKFSLELSHMRNFATLSEKYDMLLSDDLDIKPAQQFSYALGS